MSVCPECKTEVRARKEGACPTCSTPLQLYKGRYFRDSSDSPNAALVKKLEEWMSKQSSKRVGMPITFRFPRKGSYKREAAQAERFLEICEWDLELAMRTLDVLFTHDSFSFKTYASFYQLVRDWPLAMAYAKALLDEEKTKAAKESDYAAQVEQKEDVFA